MSLRQVCQAPVLEGRCPETFKYVPAATQLNNIRSLARLYRAWLHAEMAGEPFDWCYSSSSVTECGAIKRLLEVHFSKHLHLFQFICVGLGVTISACSQVL